jgi:methyl-accepting chemotaxis protein
MPQETQQVGKMGSDASRSIGDNLRELAESSQQLFDAGKQITGNLNEITQRVERASNRTSEVLTSPWLFAGVTITAAILILSFSKHKTKA